MENNFYAWKNIIFLLELLLEYIIMTVKFESLELSITACII